MSLPFPPLPKIFKDPTPHPPFPPYWPVKEFVAMWASLSLEQKRQRHGDKSCWGHSYLWTWQKIRLCDRVWSHLMMAQKLLSTWWILFFVLVASSVTMSFMSEFVSEKPLVPPPPPYSHPFANFGSPEHPPPSLHVILLLPKAKYRYKTYDKL